MKLFLKEGFALLLCSIILVGCSKSADGAVLEENTQNTVSVTPTETVTVNIPAADLDIANMFSSRDKEIGYEENNYTLITLQENSAQAASDTVKISGSTVTITDEGTYVIKGSLTNGQIIVDAEKTDKLQLVLEGISIGCDTSAPIYIKQADKVFITLADNSENTLSNNGEYQAIDENNIDAVIYSKEDLTLNGQGILEIKTEYGHGIVSKDDLVITSGTYKITAAGHGIAGKDSVRIAYGNFKITSQKDGIHGENADDTTLGYVYIAGGTFYINAQTDGIDGAAAVQIEDGEFNITTGDGSQNASTHASGEMNPNWGKWGKQSKTGTAEDTVTTEDTVSAKAIKADGNIVINGGTFEVDSSDDSIHSNTNVTINEGTFQMSSGDDGIHADTKTVINGGNITIAKSYEGIEGQSIDITGGLITLLSSDDGLNAAGGNDGSGVGGRPGQSGFTANADCYIKISGGVIYVTANGDGLDSNGTLYVTGGETYISGPENSGNGAFDYDGTAQITGGIIIAAGTSGMAQNFGSDSTQGSMLVTISNSQSGNITLLDSSGKELASFTQNKQFNSVLISTPEIKEGETYTVIMGSETQTIKMDSLIYGSGSGMSQGPQGMGGRPNDGTGKRQ